MIFYQNKKIYQNPALQNKNPALQKATIVSFCNAGLG